MAGRPSLEGISAARLKLLAGRLKEARGANTQGPAREPAASYPASFAQERLWLVQQLFADLPSYNVPMVLRLAMPARVDIWKTVMERLAARHEVIRSSLRRVDGELRQVVEPTGPVDITYLDLRDVDPSTREAVVRRHVDAVLAQPFDLAVAPLWRVGVIAMGDADSIVYTICHHSIADGGSRSVLQREASMLAVAMGEGRPLPDLGTLPVQYGDFARWQREFAAGEGDASLAYWRNALAGLPNLDLPTDRPRPPVPALRHGVIGFSIPGPVVIALRQMARESHASMFMVTLAAFAVVLQRYAGQDDVPVGTPVSTRDHVSLEQVLGYFVNTLVLRCDVSSDPTFRELIGRVRSQALDAFMHQRMPFERVLRELDVTRDLSRNPLFQVSFQVEDEMASAQGMSKAVGEFMNLEDFGMTVANIDLDVHLFGGAVDIRAVDQAMSGVATYDAELFDRETIQRLVGHYVSLLGRLAASPDVAISTFALGDDVPAMPSDPDAPRILADVERHAHQWPNDIAVIATGEEHTYGDIVARARRIANGLVERSLTDERLVGVACGPGVGRVVALLATLMAGAAFVPMAADDPVARLDDMASQVDAILVGKGEAQTWRADASRLLHLDALEAGGELRLIAMPMRAAVAYGMWTSGSTGRPKLALNTHTGLDRVVAWTNRHVPLGRGERVLHRTGFTFDVSLLELLRPLAAGATVVCARPDEANDPRAVVDLVRAHRVTTLHLVPSMLGELVALPGYATLESLRRVICAGEMLPPGIVSAAHANAGVEVLNMYGPAEAAVVVTFHRCLEAADAPFVSIGEAFDRGEFLILDHAGQPAPVGVPGEACLSGVQIGRGYADNPGLTAARWLPNRFGAPGSRMYCTGDRARRHADGSIELLGRVDHMVKLRGQRIELEGIEAIAMQVPGIGAAAARVMGVGNDAALLLWIAPATSGGTVDAASVRAHLAGHVPRGMLPSRIFVLDAMPRSRSGKIDRTALVPGTWRVGRRVAPRDGLEVRLMNLWCDLLGREDISVDDDFFASGGHSLLAVRLLARVHDEFGVSLPLASFYPRPTVEGMALALRSPDGENMPGLVRLRRGQLGAPVLVLFPAAGGRSITYLELARALPEDMTVLAFDHAMPDDSETVEDTAMRCLAEMKTAASGTPWHLGGWSTGATMAFEVARLLRHEGTPAASLSLFDAFRPYRPALLNHDPDAAVARVMQTIGRNLAVYHGIEPMPDTPRERETEEETIERYLVDVRDRALVPADFDDTMVKSFLLASERNVRAVWAYEPVVGSERTALFRASEAFAWPIDEEGELAKDDALGWRALLSGPLTVVPVQGNHVSMFQVGQVEGLADALAAFVRGEGQFA